MIIKRGLLIFVVLFLVIPFVFAANGCCGETVSENTCVYTSEENCDTPSYFNENAQCEDTSFCGVGCCVKPDGLCSEGAGEYSCDVVDGEWTDGSCDSLDACEKVCCVYGDFYTYNTEGYCENLYAQYGGDIDYYDVNSETECYEMERQSNQGCCVTEDGCSYVSLGECEVDEIDMSTGYGFFENDYCHYVAGDLEEGGYEAAAMCDCELDEDYYVCDSSGLYVLEVDTCGNQGDIVEECNYPSSICSESSGKAECISTSCTETFSFPEDSEFSRFNTYKVYYQGFESEFDFKEIQLGQSRENGETWCIYESPVGGFADRVGSRHYEAMCYNGEEIINPCGEAKDRDQVCVSKYDKTNEEFIGGCVDNNYDDYYGEDAIVEGMDTLIYVEPVSEPVEFGAVEGEEGEVEEVDVDDEDYDPLYYPYGVSTVATSGSDYCSLGTLECNLWYADRYESSPDTGWELYGNGVCLKPHFALTAADYCSARGDCGLDLNVIGKNGGTSGFQITNSRDKVGDAYVGYGFFDRDDIGFFTSPFISDVWSAVSSLLFDNVLFVGGWDVNTGEWDWIWENQVEVFYNIFDMFLPDQNSASTTLVNLLINSEIDGSEIFDEKVTDENCFDIDEAHEGAFMEPDKWDYYYPVFLQALDYNTFQRGSLEINDLYCREYTADSIEGLYYLSKQDFMGDLFARNYMVGRFFSFYDLVLHSTSFLPSETEYDEVYDIIESEICRDSGQRFRSLSRGLGFNIETGEGNANSEMPQNVRDLNVDLSVDKNYGELNLDLYTNFRSIKPWYVSSQHLESSLEGIYKVGMPLKSLTFYTGQIGWCGDNSEFEAAGDEGKEMVTKSFTCGAWEPPAGGDDCHLCDTLMSEGGLVYDKGDKVYTGTLCSEARCESLGATCAYIEENREVALYDESRPSCIDGGDCSLIQAPIRSADLELLDEQGFMYEESENGTRLTDLPVMETFKFALEVDPVSNCKFVSEDDLPEDWTTNPDAVTYESLSSTVPLSGYTNYHNFTWHVDEANYVQRFYVSCKNYCGEENLDFYLVEFETGDGENISPPVIQTTYPLDGELIQSDSEEVELKLYLNEYADCRYSENAYTDYDLMENDFLYCDNSYSGESSGLGYPICSTNIDLSNGSANLYLLCKDTEGNAMTEPQSWGVSKTEPLLISQTAPSGDLYYSEVTMQIYTTNGGDSGNSICSFKEEGSSYYVDMENSYTNYHEQIFTDLAEGSYSYSVSCEDEVGNVVEGTVEFNVVVDRSASEISGLYYLGTTLYIITDEAATCQYDDESFSYGSGTETAGSGSTDHTIAVEDGGNYYINCEDEFGNQMDEVVINLDYFVSNSI